MKNHRAQPSAGPSQRQLRVGEQMRHIIAQTLQRGHFTNPMLVEAGSLSVTEVKVTPDLKHARAYVTALGGSAIEDYLPALNDCAHVFQKEIGHQAKLKFTPKIRFVADESLDKASRIDEILRGLHIPHDEPDAEG